MRRVLIDTDAGVDDVLALALALTSPDLQIEAITTVAGNTDVEAATRNIFTILNAVSPAVWPQVAQGAANPLKRPLLTASHVHGSDGLGNITTMRLPDGELKYPEPEVRIEQLSAEELIVEKALEHTSDLTVITLGPLTNIAKAIRLDPAAMIRIGEIIIMGGAFRTQGNTSPVAEFNIFVDPEAAAEVVEFDVPKTIVPLDVTEQVKLMRTDFDARRAVGMTPLLEFIRDVSDFYMTFHIDNDGFDGCFMHDPTTIALAIDPSLVSTVPAEVHVECKGQYTAGMTVADLSPSRTGKPNANVALSVDMERILDVFFSTIGGSRS